MTTVAVPGNPAPKDAGFVAHAINRQSGAAWLSSCRRSTTRVSTPAGEAKRELKFSQADGHWQKNDHSMYSANQFQGGRQCKVSEDGRTAK